MSIGPWPARAIATTALLPTGFMALPIAAMVLDQSPKTENWIFPAQVGGTALVGAGIGSALPQIAGHAATRGRGAAVGAGMGVGAAAIGAAALFAMINGFGG